MKNSVKCALVAMSIVPLIYSCGKASSGDGMMTAEEAARREEAARVLDENSIDGLYQAKFTTLNPHINGTIPGSLTFLREKDRLLSYVRLFAGGPKAWHPQGVYLGERCPTISDDTNGDGFIDIDEAMAVVGKMIIPLDANLNSQASGRNFYPMADPSGYYHYERVASFSRMFSDLRDKDRITDDHIAKLEADEKFSFERKVFMVQGVVAEAVLPETVSAGPGRHKAYQTLPIVCGIIKKVTETPGTVGSGEIPGPIGDVVEGQDRPAGPQEYSTSGSAGGGTVGGTTGTNDSDDGEVGDDSGSRGGSTSSGSTSGGTTTGSSTTGGTTTGSSTTGGTTTGSSTTGGTTGEEPDGGTSGGRSSGGFIGGFIGGSSGGSTGGTSGGFIGGFIGGSTGVPD